MKWFGSSLNAIAAAALGCAIGFVLYGFLAANGLEAPWVVGLMAGALAALASGERNVMRGLLVGSAAVWVSAAAQVAYLPVDPSHGVVAGLASFHHSLTLPRALLHAANALLAIILGSAKLRGGARSRAPGRTPSRRAGGVARSSGDGAS